MRLLIELIKISFKYPDEDNRFVLNDINFKINEKDIIKIEGRNGSGKTTLLKIISQILKPTTGILKIEEGIKVAYFNQNISKYIGSSLTIKEQIIVSGTTSQNIINKNDKLLKLYNLGLDNKKESFMSNLSEGQKQIISLVSILNNVMDVLLLDEFTSSLDDYSRKITWDILNRYYDEHNIAIAFVNHSKLSENSLKVTKTINL